MISNPFAGGKSFFFSIPLSKRDEYMKTMLVTPNHQGQPFIPSSSYPHQDSFFYKQYKMNYYHTQVHSQPTALIFYLHGLNSYGGSSSLMATSIASSLPKINIYAIDFLNFGKSDGGNKGWIQSFEDIVNQAQTFVDYISKNFTNKPKKILVGNSFGGTICFKMVLMNPKKYKHIIFLAPALRDIKQLHYYKKKIGMLVAYFLPKVKTFKPRGNLNTKYVFKEVEKSLPHNYTGRIIPGTFKVVLNAIQEIQHSYTFQPGIDKTVDPFAVLDLQKACKSKDKTTIYMKNMWHSIFYEEQVVDVINLTIDWLKKRI